MSSLTHEEKQLLLNLAKASIQYGVELNQEIPVNLEDYPDKLKENRASFVTLNLGKALRGCIGSLEAYQPLVLDIARNAFSAAFRDPRFYPVGAEELPYLKIHISVLNQPEPMHFTSEEDLISQLRPGIDGLILSDGVYHGTFLPAVWESLSDPALFLQHLKVKAGLSPDYWSDTFTVERYTVDSIE